LLNEKMLLLETRNRVEFDANKKILLSNLEMEKIQILKADFDLA